MHDAEGTRHHHTKQKTVRQDRIRPPLGQKHKALFDSVLLSSCLVPPLSTATARKQPAITQHPAETMMSVRLYTLLLLVHYAEDSSVPPLDTTTEVRHARDDGVILKCATSTSGSHNNPQQQGHQGDRSSRCPGEGDVLWVRRTFSPVDRLGFQVCYWTDIHSGDTQRRLLPCFTQC